MRMMEWCAEANLKDKGKDQSRSENESSSLFEQWEIGGRMGDEKGRESQDGSFFPCLPRSPLLKRTV